MLHYPGGFLSILLRDGHHVGVAKLYISPEEMSI